jgi:hypothetical protein
MDPNTKPPTPFESDVTTPTPTAESFHGAVNNQNFMIHT